MSAAFRPCRAAPRLLLCAALLLCLSGCGLKSIISSDSGAQRVVPAKAQQIVATVRAQIGTRYRWGGNAPGGFDCSGLIWWGYRQHGVSIPRVTGDQARMGTGVRLADARSGDVLVFRMGSGLHTALYSGRNTFIHAPATGKQVREDSLSNTYWRPRLAAIRRIRL
jgi:cell wall-associated NlpC family hydrolase